VRVTSESVGPPALDTACSALQQGRPIMVYDGDEREGETDLFVPAQNATPERVNRLRDDAGGLVFVAVGPDVRQALGLPFLHDVYREAGEDFPVLGDLVPQSLPYDARSSFSITLNHRDTFTGITDRDRAKTIQGLGRLASLEPCLEGAELRERFVEEFRTPGHVHVCAAAEGLLDTRTGHTELAVALARLAGIPEAIVGAEILEGEAAMSPQRARQRAEAMGMPFVDADDIQQAWDTTGGQPVDQVPASPS
jgi:3,4-dihydroxy 2-butanone 4-phosphate synthase